MMDALEVNNGFELLDLMILMANCLLDYKFWFKKIKAYRKLKSKLVLPKAIVFLFFLNLDEYDFSSAEIVDFVPITIDLFKTHKKQLKT
jgi:hypothetical protein